MRKKTPIMTAPKMMRHRTVAESQGCVMPPYSSPSSNMVTPATMVTEPSQSTALRPWRRGVLGVVTLRKKKRIRKATPSKGRLM